MLFDMMNDAGDRVRLFDSWLSVPLPSGTAAFHYRWLRHNCDVDRHPKTRERTVCSSELPDDVRATRAAIEDDALVVDWAHDGRRSRYALDWLARHAYGASEAPPPPSDVGAIEIRTGDLGARVDAALALVARRGAAVVRGGEASPEGTERLIEGFERRGLTVRGTHFGRIEDLRTDNTTNANTDQLGYTDAAIDLHTDQPFLDDPPHLQLLHSVRKAEQGGANAVVDARAAAAYLAAVDRSANAILARTPVDFHRRQKSFESRVVAPIFEGEGDAFVIRYSYFTMAPHRLPFDEMAAFYRAYDAFARLVRNPDHQYRFLLEPGDWLVYDNRRMLHARTGFRGARWMRGVYFDPA